MAISTTLKEIFSPSCSPSTCKQFSVLSNRQQQFKQSIKQCLFQASLFSGLITALSLTLTESPATAATFIFDSNALAGNTTVGTHEAITTTFDDATDLFTWSVTLRRNEANNKLANGGWLVVNGGGNPKADDQESVIFYLDGETHQVSAYDYSGKHRSHSWRASSFLGATALSVENVDDERTLSFAFDMSQINRMTDTFGPNWKGTAFGDQVGIWFHGVDGLTADYTDEGNLAQFSYTHQGWYDTNAKQTVSSAVLSSTQEIPEPSGLIALGLVASALVFKSSVLKASGDDSASIV